MQDTGMIATSHSPDGAATAAAVLTPAATPAVEPPVVPPPASASQPQPRKSCKSGDAVASELEVLIIEDDRHIQRSISYLLARLGYRVNNEFDGEAGLEEALAHNYGVVVVDVMLPRMDGLAVCKQLREARREQPIIMISARDSDLDKITGLELGADDYIAKPFSPAELEVRIRGLLRRTAVSRVRYLTVNDIMLDRDRHLARRGEAWVRLTPKEMAVLRMFMSSPGRIFTREVLLSQVWGSGFEGYARAVDASIRRLKTKLHTSLGLPMDWIEGVYGTGYRIRDPQGE